MDAGEEVPCSFFVARGDGAELLDNVEEALDEVAFAVEREITCAFLFTVGLWRNHSDDFTNFQALYEGVAVIALVGDERLRLDLLGERLGLRDVVGLPTGEAYGERIA
jgi:hypothetical protein